MVSNSAETSRAVTESVDLLRDARIQRDALATQVETAAAPQLQTLTDDDRAEAAESRTEALTGATAAWYRAGRTPEQVGLLTLERGQRQPV